MCAWTGFRVVARIFYTEARQGRNSPADRCTACISMHMLRGFGGMPPEKKKDFGSYEIVFEEFIRPKTSQYPITQKRPKQQYHHVLFGLG